MNARPVGQVGVRCSLCGEKGATVPLHLRHGAGTILMVGDYVHDTCLVAQSVQVSK